MVRTKQNANRGQASRSRLRKLSEVKGCNAGDTKPSCRVKTKISRKTTNVKRKYSKKANNVSVSDTVDAMAKKVAEFDLKKANKSEDEVLAMGAIPFTKAHERKREQTEQDFVACLRENPEKWGFLL